MPDDLAIHRRRQLGLVTRAQAASAGLTAKMIAHRLATGAWSTVLPGVYLTDQRPRTAHVWAQAATLRWGTDVIVSHESAAELHDLPVVGTPHRWTEFPGLSPDPPRPHLTVVVPSSRKMRPEGITVHRRREPIHDTVALGGVRLTSTRRTIVDLLFDAPLVTAVVAADSACHADPQLRQLLEDDLAATGRVGVGRARNRLGLVEPLTESPLESLLRILLVLVEIRPRVQVPVATAAGRARVDFLIDSLVVEADGRQHHEGWDAAVADRRRQNRLVEAGFSVLRTTWQDVTNRPDEVVRSVKAATSTTPPN